MTTPTLIMESPRHANHPKVASGEIVWMPLYRCAGNADGNVPNGYGLPQNKVRDFCRLAARYWHQHPQAPKWINFFALLSTCFDPTYGSIDPDSQWHPDIKASLGGLQRGYYDLEQPMQALARVLGMFRTQYGIAIDGLWADTEAEPPAVVYDLWHRLTGGSPEEYVALRKMCEVETIKRCLDALGYGMVIVNACSNVQPSGKHWWTADEIPEGVTGAYCHIDPRPWTNENQLITPAEFQRQLALATAKQCAAVFIFADGVDQTQLSSMFARST